MSGGPWRCLIVDDEPLARKRLRRLLDDCTGADCIGEAGDAAQARQCIRGLRPDVILLDIQMPGDSGVELARELLSRPEHERPRVIFTTAHEQHALEAFELQAADYLLKPVNQVRLRQALDRLPELVANADHRRLRIRLGHNEHWLPLTAIACCLASDKYTIVHHDGGEFVSQKSLRDLELTYPDYFIRIHRNALVARDRILGLQHESHNRLKVRLRGCDIAPEVSRRYRQALQEMLKGLLH